MPNRQTDRLEAVQPEISPAGRPTRSEAETERSFRSVERKRKRSLDHRLLILSLRNIFSFSDFACSDNFLNN